MRYLINKKDSLLLFLKNPIISGSSIVIFGTFLLNILNYLFNLAMGRLLSLEEYGILASLISLINLVSVISSTTILVFTRFSAAFFSQEKYTHLLRLFWRGSFFGVITGIIFTVTFFIVSPLIGQFLHIKNLFLINITGVILLFIFLSSVPSGMLQGMLRFLPFSVINIFSGTSKLLSGIFLVLGGFGVLGGILSFLIASVFGYFLMTWTVLRNIKGHKEKKKAVKIKMRGEILKYALPAFVSTLSFTAFNSIDIIMVRHFFPSDLSGQYAALSLMGRSIFFLISPVAMVLLPVVVQKYERREEVTRTLFFSALLQTAIALIPILIYIFFPSIVITIFFKSKFDAFLPIRNELGLFAIFMYLYSLCYLLNSFFFSIKKTKVSIFGFLVLIFQVILIQFFHQSLRVIVIDLIVSSALLLIIFLIYYAYVKSRQSTLLGDRSDL